MYNYTFMGYEMSKQQWRKQLWDSKMENSIKILKQGQLQKQSKYLKKWNIRTLLLIQNFLASFQNFEEPPTSVIPIGQISSLIKEEETPYFVLKVIVKDESCYRFRSRIAQEREDWFENIKYEKLRFLKKSIVDAAFLEEEPNRLTFKEEEIMRQNI